MADEQVVDDTTKQPDESAEPPQKKRCLPEFLKEDSAKWTLDSDLAEAINGAINKRLSDENVQQFKELFATPSNVNVKVKLDPVYAKALDETKASDTRRQVFVFLMFIKDDYKIDLYVHIGDQNMFVIGTKICP